MPSAPAPDDYRDEWYRSMLEEKLAAEMKFMGERGNVPHNK
jgi:hypothetical protein